MKTVKIAHLYPKLLNIYGDGGNILALKRRCEWRDLQVEITEINVGDDIKPHDIYFMAGDKILNKKRFLKNFRSINNF